MVNIDAYRASEHNNAVHLVFPNSGVSKSGSLRVTDSLRLSACFVSSTTRNDPCTQPRPSVSQTRWKASSDVGAQAQPVADALQWGPRP